MPAPVKALPQPPASQDDASARAGFSQNLARLNAKPLWERTMSMGPGSAAIPAIWRYRDMRPELLRAAAIISTAEAERRVLMLENPGLPGSTYITNSIYTGMQIILPGEVAPAHRHSTSAMRFILEGEGAYSTVEGERVMMRPGDFVLTPYWTWHDHGHIGTEPVIWLDALDNPMAKFFGAMFRENYPHEVQPVTRAENEAAMRFGAHLFPVTLGSSGQSSLGQSSLGQSSLGRSSPLMLYSYDRTRQALLDLSRVGPIDPAHGVKLRYANPATGGYPFPTIAVFIQWLPANFAGADYRSTDGMVFCVVEGSGRITVGDREFEFEPHDIFVVPHWTSYRLSAGPECILFSYSDRAAQESLGFWRETPPV